MIRQTWKMAWSAVWSSKLRTFLTMLGIIIGVAALIILVSVAGGASDSVSSQISSMGTSYLTVQINDDKENPLRLSEFSTLFSNSEEIAEAAPIGRTSVTAKSGYTHGTMNLYGTTGSYFRIMGQELSSGRWMKQTDVENHSNVIILTYDTAVEFFGHSNAEGETILLGGKTFQIIGVLAEDESAQSGMTVKEDSDDSTQTVTLEGYIPYSTLTRLSDNALDITQFYLSSSDEESMDAAEDAAEEILYERFGQDEDAYSVQDQSEIMETMQEVNQTMSWMIGGIAAISLLVGGIGIMNIMMVSVTERTREIGIRKAIGAGRLSIMLQFLMEAVIVSMIGCGIGIAGSWCTLKILGIVMAESMSFSMNWKVVGIAVVFSAVIGIGFGLYPAAKAAAKKPIDALRYSG